MLKPLFVAVGVLSLVLGAVGIVLPATNHTFSAAQRVLLRAQPTRLHNYLINHKVFGTYINNYYNKSMTPKHKARTLTIMWLGILFSAWLIGKTITWIILPIIAVPVTIHIARLSPQLAKAPVQRHAIGTSSDHDDQ